MTDGPSRRFKAGDYVDDDCRACKVSRKHAVVAVDASGAILSVVCGFCGSRHLYRGDRAPRSRSDSPAGTRAETIELVGERERRYPMTDVPSPGGAADFEMLLRRVIREETGLTPVAPAEKWRGGEMVLRPGKPGLQDKTWPIDTFFHKVVMLRNRLRVLEQQINALEIPEDAKIKLQGYITGCYGSLTSFNVLFSDEEDRFRGAGGDD